MDSARFHELLDRYHDGDATDAELAELESRMAGDAECRRLFVERNLMEVQLGKSFASSMAGKSRRSLRRRAPGSPDAAWTVGAIAAAALFGAVVLFSSMAPDPKPETVRSKPEVPSDPQRTLLPPSPQDEPQAPKARDLERELDAERRSAEREARAKAEELQRRDEEIRPAPPREEEKPKEKPEPTPPSRKPDPLPAETRTAVATVESLQGEAFAIDGSKLVAGQALVTGQGVKTTGMVRLKFADGTQMAIEGEVLFAGGKRVTVDRGTVRTQVTKQPPGQPLVFVTPESELKVLGTTLKIIVTPGSTRLEVTEGKVQMKRLRDGRTVDVPSGFYALSAAGVELSVRQLPIADIHLAASQGQISGDEWRAVKDEQGLALEAATTANFAAMSMPIDHAKIALWFAKGRSRSWVTFTFTADADTDYYVWVRGRCIAPGDPGPLRLRADDVILEVADAAFVRRPAGWKPMTVDYLCAFNGYGARPGFWWSGGSHDPGNNEAPIALRFKRSGRQAFRMHAMETPLQIDAIWLSTTKSTRPGPEEGPGKK